MNAREAIYTISNWLSDEIRSVEIQRLNDGWHIIAYEPSDVTETRTIILGGVERTLDVPVHTRTTLVRTDTLIEAAEWVYRHYASDYEKSPEREAWREHEKTNAPLTEEILMPAINLDDFVVPFNYELTEKEQSLRVRCSNCKGKKVFRDLECWCSNWSREDEEPNPDCDECGGSGTHDSTCPVCEGAGDLQAMHILRYVNDESGKKIAIRLGGPHIPLPSAYVHNGYTHVPWDIGYLHIEIRLDLLYEQICERLGVLEDTHIVYWLGEASVRAWGDLLHRVTLKRLELADQEDVRERIDELSESTFGDMTESIAHSFTNISLNAYVLEKAMEKGVDPAEWHFRPRRDFAQLLEDLHARVSSRGYGFSFITRFYETGANPLAIDLIDLDGLVHLAELGHDYSVEITAQQAWDNAIDTMAAIEDKHGPPA